MRLALPVAALMFVSAPAGAASLDPGIMARFSELSLTAPTTQSLIICHGFGCKYRTEIGLSAADHKQLAKFLAAGRASPEAERQAIGKAVAWFQRRVAPETGTAKAIARAGPSKSGDPSQFDCIDASTNTTETLLLLEQLKLLRHHEVIGPSSRLSLVGHVSFHSTAVLAERHSGRKWAVDSWTRPNGEAPEVMPLETWSAAN